MEIVIIVAIWSVIVKRGVEDILHTARGGTPHRYEAARARRSSGAAGRYWSTLRDDTFEDLLRKHSERRDRRLAGGSPKVDRPRGAATQYFAGLLQDGRRGARRSWDGAWVRRDEKRRAKSTRPRPGQETVPGVVVPNAPSEDGTQDGAQDESQDRPQDDTGPAPHVVPTEGGRTDLRFGDDPTDPTGTKLCPECGGTVLVDGEICLSCRDRQEQRNQHYDNQTITTPEGGEQGSPDTQEGPTTMTATNIEVVGLDGAIRFCEDSARAYRAQAQAIDNTQGSLQAGGVTGIAVDSLTQAMDQANAAATQMDAAAAEFVKHKQVQEAYNANQGAGDRDFILAGQ
ncbi:hypothetical protein [Mycobacterium sp.]|jgi:hypothetical protein|uniref:hypothetical protein n=1 Tax=Mycobacterium sp. TaxID=1785 RepID=UPI002F424E21